MAAISRLTWIAVFAIAVGCGKRAAQSAGDRSEASDVASGSGSGAGSAHDAAVARTWPADAPSATDGCDKHEDCTITMWSNPLPPDPCCNTQAGYPAVRKQYLAWIADYRKRECNGVVCTAPPYPGTPPPCCSGHARCVDHRCITACEDPTISLPRVSVDDSACRLPP